MNAYVYKASLYCQSCITKVTPKGGVTREEALQGPSGPYAQGGGEADCPQHCDECGTFLENPLTTDGVEYVRERVEYDRRHGRTASVASTIWAPLYRSALEA